MHKTLYYAALEEDLEAPVMITTDMTEETDTDRMLMCICKPRMKSACPKNGEIEIFDRLLSVPTQPNPTIIFSPLFVLSSKIKRP